MTWMLLRKTIIFKELANYHFQPKKHDLYLRILRAVHTRTEEASDSLPKPKSENTSSSYDHRFRRLACFSKIDDFPNDYRIDIVDNETWQVSTAFADVVKDAITPSQVTHTFHAQIPNDAPLNSHDPEFDGIDDLRICGNLFYKLDRDSKEYEEYNFDFHKRKSSKRKGDWRDSNAKETPNSNSGSGLEKVLKGNCMTRESKMEGNQRKGKRLPEFDETDKKKQRVPTFNQLTSPYHEPFCLDIYISKASVRACIVHRATSKVVAVAHSISKDMKFDLGSTRNAAACAAVGKVLAQRALADDIHNVIYTPRKGEKLEGKLHIVLQSLINNGVWVKVKMKKKKNVRKVCFQSADYK